MEAADAAVEGYDALGELLANAADTVQKYDLPAEREAFMSLLRDVDRYLGRSRALNQRGPPPFRLSTRSRTAAGLDRKGW